MTPAERFAEIFLSRWSVNMSPQKAATPGATLSSLRFLITAYHSLLLFYRAQKHSMRIFIFETETGDLIRVGDALQRPE